MSPVKKENVIILPNMDKISTGKIKDTVKHLSMVSAEYNIHEDIVYFTIEKNKRLNILKLQYIPFESNELHSVNAKKLVLFELVRIGHGCVMQFDEDLNKRARAITDLIHSIDDLTKEAVTSKLNNILDIPGELDNLLDLLLTDPQYNSFKYTVLNESKISCLLCVNGNGLFMRSMEAPFEVSKEISWLDISNIKVKSNRLIILKKSGENEDILCISKKTSKAAGCHLLSYLSFVCNQEIGTPKRNKSWFGSVVQRIRKSFSRRTPAQNPGSCSLARNPLDVVDGDQQCESALLNRAVTMEPSIRTCSAHDVSLGSTKSYIAPSDQHQVSTVRPSGQDDHFSVKTTSTYEVSLDSGPSPKTLACGGKGDHDSSGQDLIPSGQPIQANKIPPLTHIQGNTIFSRSMDSSDDVTAPKDEVVIHDSTKVIPMSPPQAPLRQCEMQPAFEPAVYHPTFETLKPQPPTVPVRSSDPDDRGGPETARDHSLNTPKEAKEAKEAIPENISEPITLEQPKTTPKKNSEPSSIVDHSTTPVDVSLMASSATERSGVAIWSADSSDLGDVTAASGGNSSADSGLDKLLVEDNLPLIGTPVGAPTGHPNVVKDQADSESGVLAPQKKSIPNPDVQRPNRIPSLPSTREPPSPSSSPTRALMAQSPSDKENYNSIITEEGHQEKHQEFDGNHTNQTVNFSRFENEEYTVDSKTTITSVSTVGDLLTKKSIKTEISTVKASGIPAPKQYKTMTTITSTVKKPSDARMSPAVSAQKSSGIPRMASK